VIVQGSVGNAPGIRRESAGNQPEVVSRREQQRHRRYRSVAAPRFDLPNSHDLVLTAPVERAIV